MDKTSHRAIDIDKSNYQYSIDCWCQKYAPEADGNVGCPVVIVEPVADPGCRVLSSAPVVTPSGCSIPSAVFRHHTIRRALDMAFSPRAVLSLPDVLDAMLFDQWQCCRAPVGDSCKAIPIPIVPPLYRVEQCPTAVWSPKVSDPRCPSSEGQLWSPLVR